MSDFYLKFMDLDAGEEIVCDLGFDASAEDFIYWYYEKKINKRTGRFVANEETLRSLKDKQDEERRFIAGEGERGNFWLLNERLIIDSTEGGKKMNDFYLKFINTETGEEIVCNLGFNDDGEKFRYWHNEKKIHEKAGRFIANEETLKSLRKKQDKQGDYILHTDLKTREYWLFGQRLMIEPSAPENKINLRFIDSVTGEEITCNLSRFSSTDDFIYWFHFNDIDFREGKFITDKASGRQIRRLTKDDGKPIWTMDMRTGEHFLYGHPVEIEDLYPEKADE